MSVYNSYRLNIKNYVLSTLIPTLHISKCHHIALMEEVINQGTDLQLLHVTVTLETSYLGIT